MVLPPERPPTEPPEPSSDEPESPAAILTMGLFAFAAGTYGAVAWLETEGAEAVLLGVLAFVLLGVSLFCFGWSWRESRRR